MITESDIKAKELIKKFNSPYISNEKAKKHALLAANIIKDEMKSFEDKKKWSEIIIAIEEYSFFENRTTYKKQT